MFPSSWEVFEMSPDPITLADVRAARERIAGTALRTPLIRLNVDDAPADIYLKLENLQPIGSFKLRGAAAAISRATPEQLAEGVYTCSAGNMAQGVAWNARRLGIPSTAVVPDHAPETKLAAIARLGGKVIKVPFDEWWNVMVTHRFDGLNGFFVHPVSNPDVMAGNGTIGLEILEDLPDVDVIVIAVGGGGLLGGVTVAVRESRPRTRVYAVEPRGSDALNQAIAAGQPVRLTPQSVADGLNAPSAGRLALDVARRYLEGVILVDDSTILSGLRFSIERLKQVVEPAGAAALAAVLSGAVPIRNGDRVAVILSGGNVAPDRLGALLADAAPLVAPR